MTTIDNIKLPADLKAKIVKEIKDNQPEFYWDYRDELSEDQVNKILSEDEGLMDVQNEIWDMNTETIWDMERNCIMEALKPYKDEIRDRVYPDCDIEFWELEAAYDDFRTELVEDVLIKFNFAQLLRNTGSVPVRVQLYSNYDCMNSHHFEGGHYSMNGYFGDMVDVLNLNPKKVKQTLLDAGFEVSGSWRNIPSREGKELIDYDSLPTELVNSSCGANLLTFVAMLDLEDFAKKGIPSKFVIPKGNTCGLFSSWNGGGSMIEMELIRDMKVDTNKKGPDGYRSLDLVVDSNDGYSIKRVYECDNSLFGSEIKSV